MSHLKVVLFGINADPPHEGHLKIVQEVQKILGPEALFIIMPTGPHPHHKTQYACFEDRLHMTKLLFEGYHNMIVDDFEGHQKHLAYTLDTLKYLYAKYKASQYYFIIATDVANHFFSWHEPTQVLCLATPIIIPRKGYSLNHEVLEKMQAINKPLCLEDSIPEISSTEIRQILSLNKACKNMPGSILNYIDQKNLYSEKR